MTTEVVLHEDDVGDERAERRQLAQRELDRDRRQQQEVERRIDLKAAPEQEAPDTKTAVALLLPEQKARNQEAAQHEEQIDTDPTADPPQHERLADDRGQIV